MVRVKLPHHNKEKIKFFNKKYYGKYFENYSIKEKSQCLGNF